MALSSTGSVSAMTSRLANTMDPKSMPFDMKRMVYGGFKTLVDA